MWQRASLRLSCWTFLPTSSMKIPWKFEDLLSVVLTCRSLNVLFTPKIYEVVKFDGDLEDQTVSDSVLAFIWTIGARPDLGKLVYRLFMSSWYHRLESSNTLTKEIVTVSGREVEEDWPNSVVEILGCLMLSRLTELRELDIDYPGDVELLEDCSFHKLVNVSIYAEDHARGEQRKSILRMQLIYFPYPISGRSLSVARLLTTRRSLRYYLQTLQTSKISPLFAGTSLKLPCSFCSQYSNR